MPPQDSDGESGVGSGCNSWGIGNPPTHRIPPRNQPRYKQHGRDALKQVPLILLDNALVHTSPDTTVELATAQEDDRGASVARYGAGTAQDVLSHIFERFDRGEVSRSGVSTELGSAIAEERIEARAA